MSTATRPDPSLDADVCGVSLAKYAAVQAGLAEGFALDAVLAHEGIAPDVWDEADDAWSEKLLADVDAEGPLQPAFDALLAKAQDGYARRVPPLDEDPRAWLDFVRRWGADPEPMATLARLGLRSSDVVRLHRLWSRRLEDEPALARQAMLILQDEPGELPEVRPEAPVFLVAAGMNAQPAADVDEVDDDGPDDELPLFAPLPGEDDVVAEEPAVATIEPDVPSTPEETRPAEISPLRDFPGAVSPALPFVAASGVTSSTDEKGPPSSKPHVDAGATIGVGVISPFALPFPSAAPAQKTERVARPAPRPTAPEAATSAPKPHVDAGATVGVGVISPFALPFPTAAPARSAAVPPEVVTSAPKPHVDVGATVAVGIISPFALPFPSAASTQQAGSGSKVPAPSTTGGSASPPARPGLPTPARSAAPSAPMTSAPDEPLAATFVGEAPAELRAMLGKSATPFEPPSSPSAVPTPTATPTLTLQQYASLCAELAMFPERTEATFQRYGLASLRDRLAVDLAWQERLRRNPAEHQAWNELYQRWCAHLSATRPRG